jgi:hypothetical protein
MKPKVQWPTLRTCGFLINKNSIGKKKKFVKVVNKKGKFVLIMHFWEEKPNAKSIKYCSTWIWGPVRGKVWDTTVWNKWKMEKIKNLQERKQHSDELCVHMCKTAVHCKKCVMNFDSAVLIKVKILKWARLKFYNLNLKNTGIIIFL